MRVHCKIDEHYDLVQPMKRPVGVTIIAILTIISGILLTLGGLSLLALGAFFSTVPLDINTLDQQQLLQQQIQDAAQLRALSQFFGSVGLVLGAIILAVGIGYLVVSYGLLKGRGWAWIITLIITIIAIVIQVVSGITTSMFNASFTNDMNSFVYGIISQIIGLAINGVILYYLYRPNVKAYFGKFRPPTAIQR
jgi:hypothetical protein